MEHDLKIVHPQIRYKKVSLIEPTQSHYLLIAAEIDQSPIPFFILTSTRKKAIIAQAKQWCAQLENEHDVISAVVFTARVIPPGRGKLLKERRDKVRVVNYDLVILIETISLDQIEKIRNSLAYTRIIDIISDAAGLPYTTTATNVRQIMPVDHTRQGVFLFNFFYADDVAQNLAVWEYSAAWFEKATALNNSTVLLPQNSANSNYTIINHCRWDSLWDILPSLLFKKSFHSYVLDNFYANKVAARPILFKLA